MFVVVRVPIVSIGVGDERQWGSVNMSTASRVRTGTIGVAVAAVVSLLLGGLLVAPASAEATLQVNASVTGGPFMVGSQEPIPVTLTVTNAGTEERRVWGRVSNVEGSPFYVEGASWRDLDPYGAGAVLAPGETRTYDLIGHLSEWAGQPRIMIGVWRPTPNIPEIAETELTFQVISPDLTDTVSGLVFADANENRTADPGEELAGLPVQLTKDFSPIRDTVTGPDGRFAFADLPVRIGPRWLVASVQHIGASGRHGQHGGRHGPGAAAHLREPARVDGARPEDLRGR